MATAHELKSIDIAGRELEGNLKVFKFPELLQFFSMGGMTGTLSMDQEERKAELAFREGKIVNVSSNERYLRLGAMLVSTGRLSQKALEQALEHQDRDGEGKYLGEILIENGLIDPAELKSSIRLQIEEELWELFSWDSGTFHFEQGLDREPETIMVEMDVAPLLQEGIRRMEEWRVLCSQIDKPSEILFVNPDFPARPDPPLDEKSWRVLSLINGRLPVQALVRMSQLGKFETYWALDRLLRTDFVIRAVSAPKSDIEISAADDQPFDGEATIRLDQNQNGSHKAPGDSEPLKKQGFLSMLGGRRNARVESVHTESSDNLDAPPQRQYESDVALVCAAVNRFLGLLLADPNFQDQQQEPDWLERVWLSVESKFPRADAIKIKKQRLDARLFDRYARAENGISKALEGPHDDSLEALRFFWVALSELATTALGDARKVEQIGERASRAFVNCSAVHRSPEFSFVRWKEEGFFNKPSHPAASALMAAYRS